MIALIRKLAERIGGNGLGVDDIIIVEVQPAPPQGRCWVRGVVRDYWFSALLYRQHALYPWCELGDSYISKLQIRWTADDRVVANFDRGWEILPRAHAASEVLDLLERSLADRIYGIDARTHGPAVEVTK